MVVPGLLALIYLGFVKRMFLHCYRRPLRRSNESTGHEQRKRA